MKPRCPVCSEEMTVYEAKDPAGIIVERYEICHAGHYTYEFVRGEYYKRIGDRLWAWDGTFDEQRLDEISKAIAQAIQLRREEETRGPAGPPTQEGETR